MGTKQIRVSKSFHEYLKDKQRGKETLGETAERLSNDFSLYEWSTEGWEDLDDTDRKELGEMFQEINEEDDFAELDEELPT